MSSLRGHVDLLYIVLCIVPILSDVLEGTTAKLTHHQQKKYHNPQEVEN